MSTLYRISRGKSEAQIVKCIKHVTLFLVFTCISFYGFTQTKISGVVTDDHKQPLADASVYVKESANGTITDSAGHFSFFVEVKGEQKITASLVGFKEAEKTISSADTSIEINFVLRPAGKELEPVIISAGSFEASDKAKGASLTPMDAVTVAGSGADIANSLRSLPGAQQVGEREGLFVRGGTAEETKQFVDGTLIKSPNYSTVPGLPQPARLNPFLFKGILFNTGGYSALYGQALSSALILESVDLPRSIFRRSTYFSYGCWYRFSKPCSKQ